MNDRFKFRAFYKDFPLCDDEKGDYTKSFMIYNVSPYDGHNVGTYAEDFEDQLTEQGFTEDEIEQVRDYFSHYEYEDWINFWADDVDQCTGLKDKNEKLIYESDYVSDGKNTYKVFWNNTKISVVNILKNDILDIENIDILIEVIGNEHEEGNFR